MCLVQRSYAATSLSSTSSQTGVPASERNEATTQASLQPFTERQAVGVICCVSSSNSPYLHCRPKAARRGTLRIDALTHDELRHLIYVHGQRVVQKRSIDSVFILLRVCLPYAREAGRRRKSEALCLALARNLHIGAVQPKRRHTIGLLYCCNRRSQHLGQHSNMPKLNTLLRKTHEARQHVKGRYVKYSKNRRRNRRCIHQSVTFLMANQSRRSTDVTPLQRNMKLGSRDDAPAFVPRSA